MKLTELITVQEAASLLNTHPQAVLNALREGRMQVKKVLGRIVLQRSEVEAYRMRTRPDGVKPRGRPRKMIV
jgi:excisionase family DNA binding protein